MPRRSIPTTSSLADSYRLGRWFTAVRREGLLALLHPQEWHTLSAILSFTSRDGARRFTLDQLGVALALPRETARERLDALAGVRWKEHALVELERDAENGVHGAVVAPIEILNVVQPSGPDVPSSAVSIAGRSSGPPDEEYLRRALAKVGLNAAQVDWLCGRFPTERIQRQLEWLSQREARNPAAMLIRAVEQDWDAPKETP